jgi:hypothetical protein
MQWQCGSCGRGYYLRRCSGCREVSYVAVPHGWNAPWFCTWCAVPNMGFTQNQDPASATVADLALSITRQQMSFALAKDVLPVTGEQDQRDAPEVADEADPPAEQAAPRTPATRRSPRTILAVAACALAVLVVAAVLVAMRPSPAASAPGRSKGPIGQVSVTAAQVATVIFQGVPGKLSVVGTSTTKVSLTGQLRWSGHSPVAVTRLERGDHTLLLSYRCAVASACTENFRLTVPAGDAITLSQSSAQLTLSGLAGQVSVMAANVLIIATGLRTTTLVASVTSGTLTASFDAPPSLVNVTLVSAQGTLRLPAGTAYQVSQQVADGNITVAVPRAGTADHRVIAHVTSGDLDLLP